MVDLREIQALVLTRPPPLPERIKEVSIPLHWEAWAEELRSHPDQEYVQFVVQGIREACRIGFDYNCLSDKSCARNMVSAMQHPEPIWHYLTAEIVVGRIISPVDLTTKELRVQVSWFCVIQKPHQPGKG